MENEAVTEFASIGDGPVFAGSLFPFVFITIACGALSGFHSLIASGTTPKMIEKETQVRFIGYGAMLMESFVAVMAIDRRVDHRPRPLLRDERARRRRRRLRAVGVPGGQPASASRSRPAELQSVADGGRGGDA